MGNKPSIISIWSGGFSYLINQFTSTSRYHFYTKLMGIWSKSEKCDPCYIFLISENLATIPLD